MRYQPLASAIAAAAGPELTADAAAAPSRQPQLLTQFVELSKAATYRIRVRTITTVTVTTATANSNAASSALASAAAAAVAGSDADSPSPPPAAAESEVEGSDSPRPESSPHASPQAAVGAARVEEKTVYSPYSPRLGMSDQQARIAVVSSLVA